MAIAELWECLQEDPADWHRFQPGASLEDLQATSRQLKAPLPSSYCSLIRRSNGLRIFDDISILGVQGAAVEFDLSRVHETLAAQTPPLPRKLLPFAVCADGWFCFRVSARLEDGEFPIVFWNAEEGESEVTHEAFDEWLFDITEGLRDSQPA
jgi:hypothetical protein